jgi:hypothetical protein
MPLFSYPVLNHFAPILITGQRFGTANFKSCLVFATEIWDTPSGDATSGNICRMTQQGFRGWNVPFPVSDTFIGDEVVRVFYPLANQRVVKPADHSLQIIIPANPG